MKVFTTIILLMCMVSSTIQKKKCFPVTCPLLDFDPSETFADFYKNIFEESQGPDNGICAEGLEVYRVNGDNMGYPGKNRCFCRPKVENTKCDGASRSCPLVNDYYKEESLGDFYERLGDALLENELPDGCCPNGFSKRFLDPFYTGISSRLCYCEPSSRRIEWHEGEPSEDSPVIESFSESDSETIEIQGLESDFDEQDTESLSISSESEEGEDEEEEDDENQGGEEGGEGSNLV